MNATITNKGLIIRRVVKMILIIIMTMNSMVIIKKIIIINQSTITITDKDLLTPRKMNRNLKLNIKKN